jgi:hypothetical protein
MIFGLGVGVAIFVILKNLLIICALFYAFYLVSNFLADEIKEKTNKIEDIKNKYI